jgi:potassium-dependent mechanosensitive channel
MRNRQIVRASQRGAILLAAAVALSVTAAEPAASPGSNAAIPLPLVISTSREAISALSRIEDSIREDAELDRIAQALPADERAVTRLQTALAEAIGHLAADRELFNLDRDVRRVEDRLAAEDEILSARGRQYQSWTAELSRLQNTWGATAEDPSIAGAAAPVRERVAAVQGRIAALAEGLSSYLTRLVNLQYQVARLRDEVAKVAAEVTRVQRARQRRLLDIETDPLWRALGQSPPGAPDGRQVTDAAREDARLIAEYFRSGEGHSGAQLGFLVAVAAGLWLLRRQLRADGAEAVADARSRLLRHPLPIAIGLTLLLTNAFHPLAPAPFIGVALLAALVPWVLLVRVVVPARLVNPLLAFSAFFAADQVIALGPAHSIVVRLALLATSIAGAAVLALGLRPGGWAYELGDGRWRSAARAGLWIALGLLALAAVANVAGNVSLAARLARGTFSSVLLAVLAWALVILANSAVHALVRARWAQRLRTIALHQAVLEAKCATAARWAMLALWGVGASRAFGIAAGLRSAGTAALGKRLVVGSLNVSLGDVVAFGVTLTLAVFAARLLRFVLDETVLPRIPLPRGIPSAISKTAQYMLVVIGAVAALYASGIELGKFGLLAGTLGVGIGFGLQNIVNNFVSGLILLYERPMQVGDVVEVGNVMGEVRRIGIRSSTVRTFLGADVVVPNASFISSELVNWTLTDRIRRADVAVSVAYGSDPEVVKRILLGAVEHRDDVLRQPEPVVLFTGFGESALQFELRFWPARFEIWLAVASAVRETVLRELGRAGVRIPFPQRDVNIRSGDDLQRRLAARSGTAPTPGRPPEGPNEAEPRR